ncbi:MAG: nucleotidyltransferase domain-containing protein [Nitrospirae bacterium]|nr:nucleotidyltransferase domain-containing protein [Nitrospirota bacterium]
MIYTEAIKTKKTEKIEALRSEAISKARKVAGLLKERYKAKKVILFGSLIRKSYLHERSDIDLLVEGIKKKEFLKAGFDACVAATPFDVDIIPMEIADKNIVKAANKEGLEL